MKALSGLQGPKSKGIKGSWVPVDPKVLKVSRAKRVGLQGPRFQEIKGSWVPVDPKVLKVSRA